MDILHERRILDMNVDGYKSRGRPKKRRTNLVRKLMSSFTQSRVSEREIEKKYMLDKDRKMMNGYFFLLDDY